MVRAVNKFKADFGGQFISLERVQPSSDHVPHRFAVGKILELPLNVFSALWFLLYKHICVYFSIFIMLHLCPSFLMLKLGFIFMEINSKETILMQVSTC